MVLNKMIQDHKPKTKSGPRAGRKRLRNNLGYRSLHIRLEPMLYDQIEAVSKRNNLSLNAEVNKLIRSGLEREM